MTAIQIANDGAPVYYCVGFQHASESELANWTGVGIGRVGGKGTCGIGANIRKS